MLIDPVISIDMDRSVGVDDLAKADPTMARKLKLKLRNFMVAVLQFPRSWKPQLAKQINDSTLKKLDGG